MGKVPVMDLSKNMNVSGEGLSEVCILGSLN